MKRSAELKQERALRIKAQQDLTAKATTETRALNAEETIAFRAVQVEIDDLTGQIEIAETAERNQRSLEDSQPTSFKPVPGEGNPQKREAVSLHALIRSQLPNGALSGEALKLHTEAKRAAESQNLLVTGVVIPFGNRAVANRATEQTVTQDGGDYGGNLVATELQSTIEFLRPEPLIEKLGVVVNTGLTGNLRYPVNEGGIIASWEGEIDQNNKTVNKYGYVDSIPKRLSVTVPISLQNIMQSSSDLELETRNSILLAIGNAIDVAFVNGSGTGQPLGVLNHTGVNTVATGTNGSVPSWDNLVDMETAIFVENGSGAKMGYLLNPKTRGKLKKTKHEAGDLNYLMDKSGEVNGYGSYTSNHVPSNLTKGTGTALSAGIFGDYTQARVNLWGFMDLSVDDKSRKGEGLIEITVNVFADVLIRQPKAFCIAKGWITT